MIKFDNTEVVGLEATIRGLGNSMNRLDKSDSLEVKPYIECVGSKHCAFGSNNECGRCHETSEAGYIIGPKDLALMMELRNAGVNCRKFKKMINVYVDITAPIYFWDEFKDIDGVVYSDAPMLEYVIHEKEFELEDFSYEHLLNLANWDACDALFLEGSSVRVDGDDLLGLTIKVLNYYRQRYLSTKDNNYWWQIIQLLPNSYNQKRTVMMSYEVLANVYKSRNNHKLDEWELSAIDQFIAANKDDPTGTKSGRTGYGFCDWIHTLPYSELITGKE